MHSLVRITEVTQEEFWRHGYRWGYDHGSRGLPSLLDDPPGDVLADVIPMRSNRGNGSQDGSQSGVMTLEMKNGPSPVDAGEGPILG